MRALDRSCGTCLAERAAMLTVERPDLRRRGRLRSPDFAASRVIAEAGSGTRTRRNWWACTHERQLTALGWPSRPRRSLQRLGRRDVGTRPPGTAGGCRCRAAPRQYEYGLGLTPGMVGGRAGVPVAGAPPDRRDMSCVRPAERSREVLSGSGGPGCPGNLAQSPCLDPLRGQPSLSAMCQRCPARHLHAVGGPPVVGGGAQEVSESGRDP